MGEAAKYLKNQSAYPPCLRNLKPCVSFFGKERADTDTAEYTCHGFLKFIQESRMPQLSRA